MKMRFGSLVLASSLLCSCNSETPSVTADASVDMGTSPSDMGAASMDMNVPPIDMGLPRPDLGIMTLDMGTPPTDLGTQYDPEACAAWFSSVDDTLPALTGPRAAQRTALTTAGGGLRRETGKYIATWIPSGWVDATNRVVVVALHGTDGYPEADWTDWHGYFEERGWGMLAVSYLDAGVYDSATATYERVIASIEDMNSACGTSVKVHLMGFSRGSAQSFPASMLDRMADGRIVGVIANAGAWPPGGAMPPELAAVDSNATAMTGVQMWGWCGTEDNTHGAPMCDEMTNALAWVRAHGGAAQPLYESEGLGHGDFKTDTTAVNAAFDWLASL